MKKGRPATRTREVLRALAERDVPLTANEIQDITMSLFLTQIFCLLRRLESHQLVQRHPGTPLKFSIKSPLVRDLVLLEYPQPASPVDLKERLGDSAVSESSIKRTLDHMTELRLMERINGRYQPSVPFAHILKQHIQKRPGDTFTAADLQQELRHLTFNRQTLSNSLNQLTEQGYLKHDKARPKTFWRAK